MLTFVETKNKIEMNIIQHDEIGYKRYQFLFDNESTILEVEMEVNPRYDDYGHFDIELSSLALFDDDGDIVPVTEKMKEDFKESIEYYVYEQLDNFLTEDEHENYYLAMGDRNDGMGW